MKSSKKYVIFSSACYLIIWLMISSKMFEKKAFWKYDSWFPSEVSKLTLAKNKSNLSLKYWFLEANYDFWICYDPKEFCQNSHFENLTVGFRLRCPKLPLAWKSLICHIDIDVWNQMLPFWSIMGQKMIKI